MITALFGYEQPLRLPVTGISRYRKLMTKRSQSCTQEYLASILSRPDQWDSHYNLGNYYLDRSDFQAGCCIL
jgi:hypothetical protein